MGSVVILVIPVTLLASPESSTRFLEVVDSYCSSSSSPKCAVVFLSKLGMAVLFPLLPLVLLARPL